MGCPEASDCIGLELGDHGELLPSWILNPTENNVVCGPNGLMSPKLLASPSCASLGSQVITPGYGGSTSQFGPTVTITNPSATRSMVARVAVLFGTPQIGVHDGAEIQVLDLVGVAPTGELVLGSYLPVNTAAYEAHPAWLNGGEVAYNTYNTSTWNTLVAAGEAVDVSFERRVTLGGVVGGYGQVTLRTTFIFGWGLVSS